MNRTSARTSAVALLLFVTAAWSSGQTATSSGTLTWNANGSLGTFTGVDPANSANNVTCSYTHDELGRLATFDCPTINRGQQYSYDAFGNVSWSPLAGRSGTTFQPGYSASTNRYLGAVVSATTPMAT